jgi:hypothetical protein
MRTLTLFLMSLMLSAAASSAAAGSDERIDLIEV